MGGGPENWGWGLPAPGGAFAPHATVVGAGTGVTVPVWVPGGFAGVADADAAVLSFPPPSRRPAATATTASATTAALTPRIRSRRRLRWFRSAWRRAASLARCLSRARLGIRRRRLPDAEHLEGQAVED